MSTENRDWRALKYLACMPLLDRLELSAVSGLSEGPTHDALAGLNMKGLTGYIRHGSRLTAPTRRFIPTVAGLNHLAGTMSTTLDSVLHRYPVSAHWQRLLLYRLDAIAVIYRLASAVTDVAGPIGFRWYRSAAIDAAITLADGGVIGVLKQGLTSERTAFGKRVWRLLAAEQNLPSALLIIIPDEVRLRRARKLFARSPVPVYLALEEDVARADAALTVWRLPTGATRLDLHTALSYVEMKGDVPSELPLLRALPPGELIFPESDRSIPDHLLPIVLRPADKRLTDLMSDWPWVTSNDLNSLLDVSESRVSQMTTRLLGLDMVSKVHIDNHHRFALTNRGLGFVARRDRTSVARLRRQWSAESVDPHAPFTWRNVVGRRSRHLARHMAHTDAVHRFLAGLVMQAKRRGYRIVQLDPPHRASRYFRHEELLRSIHPDAFGMLRKGSETWPFFLEWENRAVRPGTMAARLAPYLRYYSSHAPLDDHGAQPVVLMVFDDYLVESRFLRVAKEKMGRMGVEVPLWVSHKAVLEKVGPLGKAWRNPDVMEQAAFPQGS